MLKENALILKGWCMNLDRKKSAIGCALLAAALYAINIPFSKLLMAYASPAMTAAFLYLGAGIGLFLYGRLQKALDKGEKQEPLTRKELPYVVGMVLLDILAPILLMLGVSKTTSANASLLNNFEIVATTLVAFVIFKEAVSKRLCLAILLVTLASAILSFEGEGSFTFNIGSLLVLGACVCWGFENNCTKMLSNKSSVEIVTIKGCFSGLGSLVIALILGEGFPPALCIAAILTLGFVAYGLSIHFYIRAQKELGAAKTSGYYSVAPFLGVAFSMALLGERPGLPFYAALLLMLFSTVLMARDSITLQHTHEHEHTHTHKHRHGNLVHTHEHTHVHSHFHVHSDDGAVHTHHHDDLPSHDHPHKAV